MLFPQLEEKLQASKQALNTATSENIIEQCKQHLTLLANTESISTNCRTSQEYVNSQHLLCLSPPRNLTPLVEYVQSLITTNCSEREQKDLSSISLMRRCLYRCSNGFPIWSTD